MYGSLETMQENALAGMPKLVFVVIAMRPILKASWFACIMAGYERFSEEAICGKLRLSRIRKLVQRAVMYTPMMNE